MQVEAILIFSFQFENKSWMRSPIRDQKQLPTVCSKRWMGYFSEKRGSTRTGQPAHCWLRAIPNLCTLVIFPTQLQMLRLAGWREEGEIWRRKHTRYPRLEVMQAQAFTKDGSLPAPPIGDGVWKWETAAVVLCCLPDRGICARGGESPSVQNPS